MKSFADLGLSNTALAAVKRMGYTQPTPVQEQAIPLVLKGRDVIAGAQTGTGKTGAFTLPTMDTLPHAKGGSGPLMLVVTPTRELAQQIGEVAGEVAVSTHHRITTVVGGLSYKPQIERLSRGTDVLIATPGRLIDLMDQKAVRLSDVRVLVLDEADRMLDMGFLPAVKKIVAATPKKRQTLLFSATIDSSIRKIVDTMLHDPAIVEIARKGDVAETVDQYFINVQQSVKPALLQAVLQEKGFGKVIVFARTRSRTETCCKKLRRAGFTAEAIHSDRSQNQRRRALDKFAAGEVNIICATDVLARGIDIEQVDYVVNYDVPEQAEDYIHRIGRTGRAGAEGFAVTFVTPETRGAWRDILKMVKVDIPAMELQYFDMEQAELEAAQHNQSVKARRDPEVVKATREMASKREQKEARAEKAAEAREAAKGKNRRSAKKRAAQAQALTQQSQRQGGHGKAGSKPRKAQGKPSGSAGHVKAGGDFRPGRAHRAEVQRQRSRKQR